jgi:hypothetical protein
VPVKFRLPEGLDHSNTLGNCTAALYMIVAVASGAKHGSGQCCRSSLRSVKFVRCSAIWRDSDHMYSLIPATDCSLLVPFFETASLWD